MRDEKEKVNNVGNSGKETMPLWKKLTAMGLCLTIILSVVFFEIKIRRSGIKPVFEVTYPEAYAAEDYKAKMDILKNNPVSDEFYRSMNNFAYMTGAELLKNSDKNSIYSPVSLYYALSVSATGAEGETKDEMLKVLGVENKDILSEHMGNLYRRLYVDNKISKLKIANSIWMSNELNGSKSGVKDAFLKNAAERFYSTSHRVNFGTTAADEGISKWISDNTKGTLKPDIKTDASDLMRIINTVYFYDRWTKKFGNAEKDDFFVSENETVKADFMSKSENGEFSRGNGFTRAGVPLEDGGEMVFILPDEKHRAEDFLENKEKLQEAFTAGEEKYGKITWKVPKFNFNSKHDLNSNLKKLGMEKAFSNEANFSGIADSKIFISSVQQETHISINEDGIEASAYTEVIKAGAAKPEDYADMFLQKPFIFGIKAKDGTLLFMGVVNNPNLK